MFSSNLIAHFITFCYQLNQTLTIKFSQNKTDLFSNSDLRNFEKLRQMSVEVEVSNFR